MPVSSNYVKGPASSGAGEQDMHASEHMSIWGLVSDASGVVQAVMACLVLASLLCVSAKRSHPHEHARH